MESNSGLEDALYIVGESGEGEIDTPDGPVKYQYQYPKRWPLEEMIAYETEELKDSILNADLSGIALTEAMKAY